MGSRSLLRERSLLDDSQDSAAEQQLQFLKEGLSSPKQQVKLSLGPRKSDTEGGPTPFPTQATFETDEEETPTRKRKAAHRERPAGEASRRSNRIAGLDSESQDDDHDHTTAHRSVPGTTQAATPDAAPRKGSVAYYKSLIGRCDEVENDLYATPATKLQHRKARKCMERDFAQGLFYDLPGEQDTERAAGGERGPPGESAPVADGHGQAQEQGRAQNATERQARSSSRDRVAPVAQAGTSAGAAASNLNSRERVHYRELQQKVQSLTREVQHLRQQCQEKDKAITTLQQKLAEDVKKKEIAEMYGPKRIAAARKVIHKNLLLGLDWYVTLYPDERTLQRCYIAQLGLADAETVNAFKSAWENDIGSHAMKLFRNERQGLAAKFVNFVLRGIQCPRLPTKPKPSAAAIAERLERMEPYRRNNMWLHGEGRPKSKMGGDVFISAAWQAVCGEGAEPAKDGLAEEGNGRETLSVAFDVRTDLLGLFIRGVELELAGAQFDSRNVDADRTRVATLARDVKTLADTGKLSSRLNLLSIPPKPPGQLHYSDYRAGAQDDLLGAADGGLEEDALPDGAEAEEPRL